MGKRPASWMQLALLFLGVVGGLCAGLLRQPPGMFSRAEAGPRTSAVAAMAQEVHTVTLRQGVDGYGGCVDTRISQENPNTNFGSEGLILGMRGRVGVLIRFDVSSIPSNVIIQEATLGLYVWNYGQPAGQASISAAYSVLRPWEEMQATWLKATGADTWGLPGCSDTTTDRSPTSLDEEPINERGQWYTWNVTSAVQPWVRNPASNKGLFLRQTNVEVAGEYYTRSSEWSETQFRPYLTVRYAFPTPTPTNTATPTQTLTPTVTATPTITLTPTPSIRWLYLPVLRKTFPRTCVESSDVFLEEFEDPLLKGWSLSMAEGQKRVWDGVIDMWAHPFIDRFPVLWRNDLFEGAGSDFVFDMRFKYTHFTGYGLTIALNSVSYDGERVPAGQALPLGLEDILSIHHVVDPVAGIYRFDATLLGGLVVWEGSPGDNEWHDLRLALEGDEEYTLYVDGQRIGAAKSTAKPRSIYIGNPAVPPAYGTWTHLHVDLVNVLHCLAWGSN